jgi:prefoldin alpha subunit
MNKDEEKKAVAENFKKELQRYFFLQQQIEALSNYKQQLDENLQEMRSSLESLKETRKIKKIAQGVFPLGAGTFIFGEIHAEEGVLINLGSNILAKKTLSEAIDIITSRIEEANKLSSEAEKQLSTFLKELAVTYKKIQEIQSKNVKLS